ncbi:DUF2953 domain-containing protein [Methanoculleus sp. Wushi-C6]|uniref:DUF2953 domain-containing protein n=1 Tax=Methanoculleus caldifontis TaxID=2651577 RepID=A0ABU3WYZ0_9EURY|nr:DUF2953 domain-containing protein [Methanoculleus sp. Wushi-C6]MDV2481019.1 DUF2953 domain-containing protein [Methanoculleus sp. Wushi-C6]
MAATLLFFVLLAVAVIFLLVLLALYLVPVTVEAATDCTRESARAKATVTWGIVGVRVRVTGDLQVVEILLAGRPVMTRDLAEMAKPSPPEEREEKERRPALSTSEYLSAAGDLWPHVKEIIAAFFRSLYLERLWGDITLGLESPATTGTVYGYCTAVRYALWPADAIDFVMTPVFDREVFEGAVLLRLQIRRPLLILIPVVRALLQRPVRERLRQVSGRGAVGV